MDPNAALAELRTANAEFDQAPDHDTANAYATVALMAAQGLDEWLSSGGFLPAAWNTRAASDADATHTLALIIDYWRCSGEEMDGADFIEFVGLTLTQYGADLSPIDGDDDQ